MWRVYVTNISILIASLDILVDTQQLLSEQLAKVNIGIQNVVAEIIKEQACVNQDNE